MEREAHFTHLPHYIHLNPLDTSVPEWRDGKIKDPRHALVFLATYRWSSLPDYLNIPNFPTVTNREFLTECIGGSDDFQSAMEEWIRMPNFDFVQRVTLE